MSGDNEGLSLYLGAERGIFTVWDGKIPCSKLPTLEHVALGRGEEEELPVSKPDWREPLAMVESKSRHQE
jgi:hypothetical protein